MTIRLHLRRIRVVEVLVDLVEALVVAVSDARTVVRCRHCGFLTAKVHDRRRVKVHDLPHGGRPTVLVWIRRRFSCGNCGERHVESHPQIRGKVTRRLQRQMVRDAREMTIKAVAGRYGVSWWLTMRTVKSHAEQVEAHRRRARCNVLLIDETSLRRRHRYVTVLSDGETGAVLGVVRHRDSKAVGRFLDAQGPKWRRGVKVVVSDGSKAYRAAINHHLSHARHVLDRFHVARWFTRGVVETRRRIQRIGPVGSRPAFDPEIFRSRYLQLMRADRLSDDQAKRLGGVLGEHPELERAWRMTQHLYGIHVAGSDDEANQALGAFLELWGEREIAEFLPTVDALVEWADEIFNFHDCDRITNGQLEGRMNKLGVLKRTAYGFTNVANFRARAILISPGLAS
jgi:transposase